MRSFRILYCLLSLAFLVGCAALPEPGVRWKGTGVKGDYLVTRNLIYTPPDWPEKIPGDLYRPDSIHSAPAVLLIHGGGWTGKDGRWQMETIARQLVKRGYVVLNVTYRLAPKYIYPSPIEDMRVALKWMREHATEQGIDPKRIAVFGYSAGGYLASMVGYTEPKGRICAVVAGGTPSNLSLYPGGELVPQFLGGTRDQIPERFRDASPVNHISNESPATFVYHASEDKLVPHEHAWELINGLEAHHVRHESYWIYGKDHVAAFLFPAGAIRRAIDFLDETMRE